MHSFWISQVSLVIPGRAHYQYSQKLDTGLYQVRHLGTRMAENTIRPSMTDKLSACRDFSVVRTANP